MYLLRRPGLGALMMPAGQLLAQKRHGKGMTNLLDQGRSLLTNPMSMCNLALLPFMGKHCKCVHLGKRMQPPKNPGNCTLTLCLSSRESWISWKGKWTLFSNYCWWMIVQNDYQISAFNMLFLWPHLVGQTSWERTAVRHHSRQKW